MQFLAAVLLEKINCCQSGAACREHGIYDEDLSLIAVSRELAVIFYGLQCLGISVQTDVADLSCRDHGQHAVYHAQTCSEDRNYSELLALDLLYGCLADRCLDLNIFKLKMSCSLIALKHCDLADAFAELLGSDLFAADEADLMLDHRVVHNYYFCHFTPPNL